MAAGIRKQLLAFVAVALVAMLLVAPPAAAQYCGVSDGTMRACMSYCSNRGSKDACCGPMKNANVGCLCSNYWRKYSSVEYIANCARKISSDCDIDHC